MSIEEELARMQALAKAEVGFIPPPVASFAPRVVTPVEPTTSTTTSSPKVMVDPSMAPKVMGNENLKTFFIQRAAFQAATGMDNRTWSKLVVQYDIEKGPAGCYPILKLLQAMGQYRASTSNSDDVDIQLKKEKITAQQINNKMKLKELIPRSAAIQRIKTTCLAIADKIRYSIKVSAPQIVGLSNAVLVEQILTQHYNNAIDSLLTEAKMIVTWEDFNVDITSGVELVEDSEEDTSDRGSRKAPPTNEE